MGKGGGKKRSAKSQLSAGGTAGKTEGYGRDKIGEKGTEKGKRKEREGEERRKKGEEKRRGKKEGMAE